MKNSIENITNQCVRRLRRTFHLSREDREDLLQEVRIYLYRKFGEKNLCSLNLLYTSGYHKGLNIIRNRKVSREKNFFLNDHELIDKNFEPDLINHIYQEQNILNLPSHLYQFMLFQKQGGNLKSLAKHGKTTMNKIMKWKKQLKKTLNNENKS